MSRSQTRAFTLLEIVVVIFIVSLALLLVYPKIGVLTEDGLRAASRQLVGVIQRQYHESMSTREVRRMTFQVQGGEYTVAAVDPRAGATRPGEAKGRRASLPRGVVFQDIVTPRQGKVTEGEAFTQFYPAGRVEKTIIHLADEDQLSYTLWVNPVTGKVKVMEGYVEVEGR